MSFRSGSFAFGDNSPSLTRRAVGRGGGIAPASNFPMGSLRSKSSRPILNDSDSQESIGSTDRSSAVTTASVSMEKTSAVVFNLGDEPLVGFAGSFCMQFQMGFETCKDN